MLDMYHCEGRHLLQHVFDLMETWDLMAPRFEVQTCEDGSRWLETWSSRSEDEACERTSARCDELGLGNLGGMKDGGGRFDRLECRGGSVGRSEIHLDAPWTRYAILENCFGHSD